jgi:hypothetical protein
MREHIEDLRAQLEAERQAHAEARRLLLSALEKIPPAIEAPTQEARDSAMAERRAEKRRSEALDDVDRSPEAAADQRQAARERRRWTDDTPTDAGEGPQSGSERRWWEFWR